MIRETSLLWKFSCIQKLGACGITGNFQNGSIFHLMHLRPFSYLVLIFKENISISYRGVICGPPYVQAILVQYSQ